MASSSSSFFNGIASFDQNVLKPVFQRPIQDLISLATLKVDEQGKPVGLDANRNQEGFHPYGAVFVATIVAWGALGITNFVCNIVVPYNIRSHVMLATKIAVGSCLFHLIGTAISSIRLQSEGAPALDSCGRMI